MRDEKSIIRVSVGAETSPEELEAVSDAFNLPDIDVNINASFVRAGAGDLPMYISMVAFGIGPNALWDLIKFVATKLLNDKRISRRHSTQITIRRKKYEAYIAKGRFQVRHTDESYEFPDIESLEKYVKSKGLDND